MIIIELIIKLTNRIQIVHNYVFRGVFFGLPTYGRFKLFTCKMIKLSMSIHIIFNVQCKNIYVSLLIKAL